MLPKIFLIPSPEIITLATGIKTTMYGIIYLDLASHTIWKQNPPKNIVTKNISSNDKFFLFCTNTIIAQVNVNMIKAF